MQELLIQINSVSEKLEYTIGNLDSIRGLIRFVGYNNMKQLITPNDFKGMLNIIYDAVKELVPMTKLIEDLFINVGTIDKRKDIYKELIDKTWEVLNTFKVAFIPRSPQDIEIKYKLEDDGRIAIYKNGELLLKIENDKNSFYSLVEKQLIDENAIK